jgi:hypothetical protein
MKRASIKERIKAAWNAQAIQEENERLRAALKKIRDFEYKMATRATEVEILKRIARCGLIKKP